MQAELYLKLGLKELGRTPRSCGAGVALHLRVKDSCSLTVPARIMGTDARPLLRPRGCGGPQEREPGARHAAGMGKAGSLRGAPAPRWVPEGTGTMLNPLRNPKLRLALVRVETSGAAQIANSRALERHRFQQQTLPSLTLSPSREAFCH